MKAPGFFWQPFHPAVFLLWPLSLLYGLVVKARRHAYRAGWLRVSRLTVPVVIIGNITVGGTGKTPLVIWAARHLKSLGHNPGVILRGYGGRSSRWPKDVNANSDPAQVGDEAVLLARHSGCPVVAGPDRVAAARRLTTGHHCDLVLSDDGLQHYALARDAEISVLDQARMLGNGRLLPAGPLRESGSRLREVDLAVVNGDCGSQDPCFRLVPGEAVNLHDGSRRPLVEFRHEAVHAVAGIGHPERFFDMLRDRGLSIDDRSFPDHHEFGSEDLEFSDDHPVLMTEKDAVKCRRFAASNHWYVPVTAEPGPRLIEEFTRVIARLFPDGQKNT